MTSTKDITVKYNAAYFSKEEAMKQQNKLGRLFYRLGAARLYIKNSSWHPHLNWWHPLTWLTVVMVLTIGIIQAFVRSVVNVVVDVIGLFPVRDEKVRWVSEAPSRVMVYEDIVVVPQNSFEQTDADNGHSFFAKSVTKLNRNKTISIGDKVKTNCIAPARRFVVHVILVRRDKVDNKKLARVIMFSDQKNEPGILFEDLDNF